jgi:hypothetical protein
VDLKNPLKSDLKMKFKFKVINIKSEWFAMGISDESNVYTIRKYHDLGHFSYIISANGIVYSSHDPQ